MKKTILILGGDGYYGWPLAMKIAVQYPNERVVIADNEWRRATVKSLGFCSLIPIASPAERIAAFSRIHNQTNLHYISMDVNSAKLEELIENDQPHTIFHLAQQGSAAYSMKGIDEALFTVNNNEQGNMRLIWAVRKHVPDAHIIKLGSFGEYAHGGIDIAEGYFLPEHKGKKATRPMPFPRESNDIYHVSKINDSNYLSMACRVWNLRITDVMQSTIFGFTTEEMAGCEELYTRCDYDEMFGTVLNRFLIQAVAGHPLTVYGKGNQRTGLMSLKDSVNSLARLVDNKPEPGCHKVINHVTETNYSINELAATVKEIAGKRGYDVNIIKTHDPRCEQTDTKPEFGIDTAYKSHDSLHTPLADIAGEMLTVIEQYKYRISHKVFAPKVKWDNVAVNETAPVNDEQYWESYRLQHFNSERINLNPGTLGTTSLPVKRARSTDNSVGSFDGFPLAAYEQGREKHEEINRLCAELWPSEGYHLTVTHSTSQTMNLLALAMIRRFNKEGAGPYKIITTTHEHEGGIGCFHHLPEFEVHYIEDAILYDGEAFAAAVQQLQPVAALFSHVFYDTGNIAPVQDWCHTVKQNVPGCKIILDAAQSLGLYDIPFGKADMVLGSVHKWLHGPHGGGLMWMKDECFDWIEGIYWSGHGLAYATKMIPLSIPGGQDFQMYPAIAACLKLFRQTGKSNVPARSSKLGAYFQKRLHEMFSENGICHAFLNKDQSSPVITIAFTQYDPYDLYKHLNEHSIHTKCIKAHKVAGSVYNILRVGIPYFETLERLNEALNTISDYLSATAIKEKVDYLYAKSKEHIAIHEQLEGVYIDLYESNRNHHFLNRNKAGQALRSRAIKNSDKERPVSRYPGIGLYA